jgi:hypothetical protein
MIKLILFSPYQFNTSAKIHGLFDYLERCGGPFSPVAFIDDELTVKPYWPEWRSEPLRMLAEGGSLLLQGNAHHSLSWFQWSNDDVGEWHLEIDEAFFTTPENIDAFVGFLIGLCEKFPIAYGGAASEEDWQTKHWLREKTSYGQVVQKIGLDVGQSLPGIYWLTYFGPKSVTRLGRARLEALPVRSISLQGKGILLILRDSPLEGSVDERCQHDERMKCYLGRECFFDIKDCALSISDLPSQNRERNLDGRLEDFEEQVVLSPEGIPYQDIDHMAEAIVVYFHWQIPSVLTYSPSVLQTLDDFFLEHPPALEFKYEFLMSDFIPSLGAYLGKVLVLTMGGSWHLQWPMLKSSLVLGLQEVHPFRDAFKVVFQEYKLMDAIRNLAEKHI